MYTVYTVVVAVAVVVGNEMVVVGTIVVGKVVEDMLMASSKK